MRHDAKACGIEGALWGATNGLWKRSKNKNKGDAAICFNCWFSESDLWSGLRGGVGEDKAIVKGQRKRREYSMGRRVGSFSNSTRFFEYGLVEHTSRR